MGKLQYFTDLNSGHLGMISLINHDFQWGRSEVVIIYPDIYIYIYTYSSIIIGPWDLGLSCKKWEIRNDKTI